ncbi:MAG: TMEM165/GDT1 family protein [Deltaproteobacteria bacterium]|nr:TMEM165/GDT1 family protein [Deltaproteobacteria bacterium]
MDFKMIISTFALILLAELGDKTQLATLCLAAESKSKLSVFIGAAGALVLTSLIAVILGVGLNKIAPQEYIRYGAGLLFIIFGFIMIFYK